MSNEDTFYFQKIGTCADDFFFNKEYIRTLHQKIFKLFSTEW